MEECYVIDGAEVTWPRGLDCPGYRLPTEAEWEYAARAGTQTAWSCGADAVCLDGVAWYSANSGNRTHAVGGKNANAWGLHDMHGNVYEWVWDWYAAGYYADDQVDPTGPAAGGARVYRGGALVARSRQARAENAMIRHRRLAGDGLRASAPGAQAQAQAQVQAVEARIAVSVLHRMFGPGMPGSEAVVA